MSKPLALKLRNLLVQQYLFYEQRQQNFERIAARLDHVANFFYAFGLILVVVRAVYYAVYSGEKQAQGIYYLLNLCAMVIPALAPLFLGLRAQGEYFLLARRYGAMAAILRAVLAEIERPDMTTRELRDVLRRTASVFLAEVADWRALLHARSISRI